MYNMRSIGYLKLGQWRKLFTMFKLILMQSLNIFGPWESRVSDFQNLSSFWILEKEMLLVRATCWGPTRRNRWHRSLVPHVPLHSWLPRGDHNMTWRAPGLVITGNATPHGLRAYPPCMGVAEVYSSHLSPLSLRSTSRCHAMQAPRRLWSRPINLPSSPLRVASTPSPNRQLMTSSEQVSPMTSSSARACLLPTLSDLLRPCSFFCELPRSPLVLHLPKFNAIDRLSGLPLSSPLPLNASPSPSPLVSPLLPFTPKWVPCLMGLLPNHFPTDHRPSAGQNQPASHR
jgi:hypothetical protein